MIVQIDSIAVGIEDVIHDETYDLPIEVAASIDVDPVMAKMETAVEAGILDAFKQSNPAQLWLFGEDRTHAVRKDIIPAHWFEKGACHHGRFAGTARPGEFFVFQVCVIAGITGLMDILPECTIPALVEAVSIPISKPAPLRPGEARPFWLAVQVPRDAQQGIYQGRVNVGLETMSITLDVTGVPLDESGTDEAWRLARLKWLDSDIGESSTDVTHPFVPVKVNLQTRELDILGRRITLGENGIPAQYTSYFSGSNTKILSVGRDVFSTSPEIELIAAGKRVQFEPVEFKFTCRTPVAVGWEALSKAGSVELRVTGRLEYDGTLQLRMIPSASHPVLLEDVRLTIPFANDIAKYAMGLGLEGGFAPAFLDWQWDAAKNQDAFWVGEVNAGVMLRFKGANYRRPLINAYYAFRPLEIPESWGGGRIRFQSGTLVANSGDIEISPGRNMSFDIDWHFTPFKPLDVNRHFTDRYYHAKQGAPVEDTTALREEGVNIIEVHHNRLCNPYLNYPYHDDSIDRLADFVKRAHADDIRVTVYYTTRELTQNLPEFFALRSLDGEVILPRSEGAAWPVTNPHGPHPWLTAHVGDDIVPAWRENLSFDYRSRLDLAVITTPDSRWNNFYLEGLHYLIRKAGIDGLYIDDTALDGRSMQRARRILDADGNHGRRINMHSWNHFNPLGAWANSSIAFMELYPWIDGLWHGERFDADASPEYMLTEMSGIPFGLMSEMLANPNPWHGMVFGMRTRWPWSGDPREQWKFEQRFGIADAEFIGWFDPACPVKADNANVKVSVFRKAEEMLISIGNWGGDIDIRLGFDRLPSVLTAPEIHGFQTAASYSPEQVIPVPANRGLLLIASYQS